MKQDFETFYSNINDQELKAAWEDAKNEKNKIKIISISCIIFLDIFIIINVYPNFFKTAIGINYTTSFISGIMLIFLLIMDLFIYLIVRCHIFKKRF